VLNDDDGSAASFCTFGAKGCQCNPDGAFAKLCKANNICGQWAGKDIDWPDGGAYGFSVTFRADVADDRDHRPTVPPARCLSRATRAGRRP